MIPFFDARAGYEELAPELDAAALRALRSGTYILGDEVEAFERAFAAYCGTEHCAGVGNGLDALTLILRALGVGPGDEVVVPAHTYVATWLAVSSVGAVPVPVEPDPDTWNTPAAAVAAAIGPRTRAVVCVHLHGRLCETEALAALCADHGLPLVEDAAQAHGARRASDGRRAGALGRAAAFSFYPTKNLGAHGDGGAVTTDDPALAERVRMLRNYGSRRKYDHEHLGVNSRLDPIQAALLGVKLGHLDRANARRRALVARYRAWLTGVPGVTLPAPAGCDHVWHVFAVLVEDRERVQRALTAAGIATLVHYPIPPHRSGAYAGLGHGPFPVTERLSETALSLPLFPQMAPGDVDAVCSVLIGALARSTV